MTVIKNIIKGLEAFLNNQNAIIKDAIESNAEALTKLQTEQLLDGKDNKGDNITPKYRNPRYAALKQAQNPRPLAGTPDLKKSGKYHKKFKQKIFGQKVTYINSDSKDAMLSKKYENIKGLNPNSLSLARDIVIVPIRKTFIKFVTK